ncbi:MAG: outer membrane protein assembly factor BamE [Paracoccaceae bacterium]|nr:outer membrane protein assembly factor BamE [Paracoccaceae bacterium]
MRGMNVKAGAAALLVAITVSGCARIEDRHGYVPEPSALDDVVVGRDTRETVGLILGQPGTDGIVSDQGWFYVQSSYERFLWREPVEVDRDVVSITFDEAGIVQNIETFGLEAGQVVVLNRRVTNTNVQGIGFLRQLFSNLGNIDPSAFINDN